MNCDERRDLLLLRSLGALTPEEEAELRDRLAQECPPLAEVEAEIDATLAQIAGGLPPVPPSPEARAAFLARLAAAPRPRPAEIAAGAPALPATSPGAATSPRAASSPRAATSPRAPGSQPAASPGGPYPPRQAQPTPARSALRTVVIAGLAAVISVAVVWAPFQRLVDQAHREADTARQEADSAFQRRDQLAKDLAGVQAELKGSQSALEAKAAAVTARLADLERLLTAAKGEVAKRDAQLGVEEAALVAARSDVQHFQELAAGVAGQIATVTRQQQQLAARLAQAETTMAALRSPQLKIFDLAGGSQQPKAWARLLWDQQRNEWHLLASDLAPLPADRTYELWFITAGQQKVAAGTFSVDANGRGALMSPIPPNIGMLGMAAVTDEPMGGVAAPTGAIQLSAKL
jgi:anti-sigma-K factor RskA